MTTSKHQRKKYRSFAELIPDCMKSVIFRAEGIKGFAHLKGNSRVAVTFGDNATGKSLMQATFRSYIGPRDESDAERLTVSMNIRTNGEMAKQYIYLDESHSSTGAASLKSVRGMFFNAKQRKWPVWIFLDEPDTGLSDRYASAMGAYIAQEINQMPDNILGVSIVTHSRPLLRRMLKELNEQPHEISMGEDRSLEAYLNPDQAQEASIEELFKFGEQAALTLKNVTQAIHGN